MAILEGLFFDFVTLLAIVNPIQAAAAFATLTYNAEPAEQRRIAARAAVTALIILVVFAFIGELLLKALGISFGAFRVAGGLLILLVGINMVFAKDTQRDEAPTVQDPSTFPLAIPIIAGPGALTTIVALISKRRESPLEVGLIVVIAVLVIALAFLAMRLSQPLLRYFGSSGVNAVGRVMGIIVASIAVQLMVNGIRELFPL
ncbi:MAG TPA: MarC family protein [Candidatus Baltobacteraceae bacterium]|nr:MarC family protein [Candidatus Baltobacteraceae bacterium]